MDSSGCQEDPACSLDLVSEGMGSCRWIGTLFWCLVTRGQPGQLLQRLSLERRR